MSLFRTTRISNPRFELGGIRQLTCKSPALQKRVDCSIFIPEEAKSQSDVPVIVLLHGVYGSHFSWNMRAGAYQTLQEMISRDEIQPVILVTPSDGLWGDGSGYVNHGVENYEAWIGQELPELIEQEIDQVSSTSRFFIGGLSMGGWGAFWIGLQYNRYEAISAHSAITHIEEMGQFVEEDWSYWQDLNGIVSIEELISTKTDIPPIRFDCGASDELITGNRKLHQYLLQRNINHKFDELEGSHEWSYWEKNVRKTFEFFNDLIQEK